MIWGFGPEGVSGSRWEVKEFAFTELSSWVITWIVFKKRYFKKSVIENQAHLLHTVQGMWRWGTRECHIGWVDSALYQLLAR